MAMFGPHSHRIASDHTELVDTLVHYHDSGAYQRDIDLIGQQALDYLYHLPDADSRQAIVLDLDETSWFNNWPKLVDPEVDNPKAWDTWFKEAKAPPIQSTFELFTTARSKNFDVFFITGRLSSEKEYTENNLRFAGYREWKELFLYPDEKTQNRNLVFPEAATFKTAVRWSIVNLGYTIMLNMGDQLSDVSGGFAEKTFKLPNPFYTVI